MEEEEALAYVSMACLSTTHAQKGLTPTSHGVSSILWPCSFRGRQRQRPESATSDCDMMSLIVVRLKVARLIAAVVAMLFVSMSRD